MVISFLLPFVLGEEGVYEGLSLDSWRPKGFKQFFGRRPCDADLKQCDLAVKIEYTDCLPVHEESP